jgi:hypothetical protein
MNGQVRGMYSYTVGATYSYGEHWYNSTIEYGAAKLLLLKLVGTDGKTNLCQVDPIAKTFSVIGEMGNADYNDDYAFYRHTMFFTAGAQSSTMSLFHQLKGMAGFALSVGQEGQTEIGAMSNITIYRGYLFMANSVSLNVYYLQAQYADILDPNNSGFWKSIENLFSPHWGATFSLDGLVQLGGTIMKITTLSRSGADSLTAYLCIITDAGEVVLFEGTDPSDMTGEKWQAVGLYRITPPLNKQCFVEMEGDIVIATKNGLVSLRRVVFGQKTEITEAMEYRLMSLFSQYQFKDPSMSQFIGLYYHPKNRLLIFNVPEDLPLPFKQLPVGYTFDDNKSVVFPEMDGYGYMEKVISFVNSFLLPKYISYEIVISMNENEDTKFYMSFKGTSIEQGDKWVGGMLVDFGFQWEDESGAIYKQSFLERKIELTNDDLLNEGFKSRVGTVGWNEKLKQSGEDGGQQYVYKLPSIVGGYELTNISGKNDPFFYGGEIITLREVGIGENFKSVGKVQGENYFSNINRASNSRTIDMNEALKSTDYCGDTLFQPGGVYGTPVPHYDISIYMYGLRGEISFPRMMERQVMWTMADAANNDTMSDYYGGAGASHYLNLSQKVYMKQSGEEKLAFTITYNSGYYAEADINYNDKSHGAIISYRYTTTVEGAAGSLFEGRKWTFGEVRRVCSGIRYLESGGMREVYYSFPPYEEEPTLTLTGIPADIEIPADMQSIMWSSFGGIQMDSMSGNDFNTIWNGLKADLSGVSFEESFKWLFSNYIIRRTDPRAKPVPPTPPSNPDFAPNLEMKGIIFGGELEDKKQYPLISLYRSNWATIGETEGHKEQQEWWKEDGAGFLQSVNFRVFDEDADDAHLNKVVDDIDGTGEQSPVRALIGYTYQRSHWAHQYTVSGTRDDRSTFTMTWKRKIKVKGTGIGVLVGRMSVTGAGFEYPTQKVQVKVESTIEDEVGGIITTAWWSGLLTIYLKADGDYKDLIYRMTWENKMSGGELSPVIVNYDIGEAWVESSETSFEWAWDKYAYNGCLWSMMSCIQLEGNYRTNSGYIESRDSYWFSSLAISNDDYFGGSAPPPPPPPPPPSPNPKFKPNIKTEGFYLSQDIYRGETIKEEREIASIYLSQWATLDNVKSGESEANKYEEQLDYYDMMKSDEFLGIKGTWTLDDLKKMTNTYGDSDYVPFPRAFLWALVQDCTVASDLDIERYPFEDEWSRTLKWTMSIVEHNGDTVYGCEYNAMFTEEADMKFRVDIEVIVKDAEGKTKADVKWSGRLTCEYESAPDIPTDLGFIIITSATWTDITVEGNEFLTEIINYTERKNGIRLENVKIDMNGTEDGRAGVVMATLRLWVYGGEDRMKYYVSANRDLPIFSFIAEAASGYFTSDGTKVKKIRENEPLPPVYLQNVDLSLVPLCEGVDVKCNYTSTQYVFDSHFGTWSSFSGINMMRGIEHNSDFYVIVPNHITYDPTTKDYVYTTSSLRKFDPDSLGDYDPTTSGQKAIQVSYKTVDTYDLGIPNKKVLKRANVFGTPSAFWQASSTAGGVAPFNLTPFIDFKSGQTVSFVHALKGSVSERVLGKHFRGRRLHELARHEKKLFWELYAAENAMLAKIGLPLIAHVGTRFGIELKMNITEAYVDIYGYEIFFDACKQIL